jgi:hypothetical protein
MVPTHRPLLMRPFPSLLAVLVCAALAPVGDVAAQSSPTRPPLRPDSTLSPGPSGAGFAEWRSMIAARGRTGASFLVEADRYQVHVMTPMAIDALAQDSLTVKATRGCQRALSLSDEQVEFTRRIDPWVEFDSASYARPLVVLAVFPKEQRRFDCHSGELPRFAAMSRGALYGLFDDPEPRAAVARVEVRRDGLEEFTPLSGRAKVTKLTRTTFVEDGSEHVRVYVDVQAFSPDAEGKVPSLELHVFNGVDPEPDILPMPDRLIRAVWQQMLPWQARQLDVGDTRITPPPLHFATPKDSALRVAHEAFERGALGTAASEVMMRLMFRPRPDQADIRNSMLEAATAFTLRDRPAEALSLVTDVMEVYPCLTFAPEAPTPLKEMAEATRKPARCTSVPLPIIALRSIVPGWGQATGPVRRNMALGVLAGTVASYGLAEFFRARARTDYERYASYTGGTTTPEPVESMYRKAQTGRNLGNAFTVAAVTVWVGGGVEALWSEYQHKRRLAEVREVGRTRGSSARGALAVSPLLSVDRVGFQVRFE